MRVGWVLRCLPGSRLCGALARGFEGGTEVDVFARLGLAEVRGFLVWWSSKCQMLNFLVIA